MIRKKQPAKAKAKAAPSPAPKEYTELQLVAPVWFAGSSRLKFMASKGFSFRFLPELPGCVEVTKDADTIILFPGSLASLR